MYKVENQLKCMIDLYLNDRDHMDVFALVDLADSIIPRMEWYIEELKSNEDNINDKIYKTIDISEDEYAELLGGSYVQKRINGVLFDLKKADFDPAADSGINIKLLNIDWDTE